MARPEPFRRLDPGRRIGDQTSAIRIEAVLPIGRAPVAAYNQPLRIFSVMLGVIPCSVIGESTI